MKMLLDVLINLEWRVRVLEGKVLKPKDKREIAKYSNEFIKAIASLREELAKPTVSKRIHPTIGATKV